MRIKGILNYNKLIMYFFMLIFGISLIFYGLMTYSIQMGLFKTNITDEEIIERAKGLGMVEIKTIINEKGEKND